MIPEIRERYSRATLLEAAKRYGVGEEDLLLLDGFESYIYEFSRDKSAYILRIGHSLRRSENMIRGEVDWINYLAAGRAGVARAILSENDRLVEPIDDGRGEKFLATAFVKARGRPVWEQGGWNEALMESYGRLIGRMHALSTTYEPPSPALRRFEWDHPQMLDLEESLPPSDSLVLERFHELMGHLRALPKDHASYGLIHQDAHAANLFVDDEGNITLFDFDDCVYGWYVYDLAMVLFYAVTNRDDAAEFGPYFWEHLMRGYRQEYQLDPAWMVEIPNFLKLREIDLYGVIHRDFDEDEFEKDPWIAKFMLGRKEAIERGTPYIVFPLELN